MDVSNRSSPPRRRQLQGPHPPRLAVCEDSRKVRKPLIAPQLQGPRPPRLTVREDSRKVRKPLIAPQLRPHRQFAQQQQQHQHLHQNYQPQQQGRAPVIIYDTSPKVIHAKPGEFMSLVQRLTGPGASGAASTAQFEAPAEAGPSAAPQPREFLLSPTAALSPAARLAAIERSVRPLPPAAAPADYGADFYSSSGADMSDVDNFAAVHGPSSRPGILLPAALPPAASTVPFSPMRFDPSSLSWLADLSPFLPSASARAAELKPLFAPSPRSNTNFLKGKRYTCQDCSTSIGFNLCEACHNSRSKIPRRLNQQHTLDHPMEVDNSTLPQWFQKFHGIPKEGTCNMEDKVYKHGSFGLPVSTKKSSSFQGGGGETSPRLLLIDEHHGDSGTKLPVKIESSSLEKDNSTHDSRSQYTMKAEYFAIRDETNNFVSTSISTYDQKGFTVGFSPSHGIIGNADDKHEEIIVRAIDKLEIMELITSQDPTNKRCTIVCIVGVDGIGKTTLASLVYCDDSMRITFEAWAWLWLSDICDYEELLRSAVASLTGVSCRLNDRDELEELLKEELTGKRFLLVLDNLCENNVEVCRKLSSLLNVADKGSAVIVTTSSNMVAEHLGTTHAYNLKALMSASFLSMAKPNFIEYPPLETIISKIPSHCSGLPMFAKAIRGILYSASTQKFLDGTVGSMLTEILSKPSNNYLPNLLRLSYSYLIPSLKMCFLYCSLFPSDHTYNKDKLLRLWMSQGFITPRNEKHGHDNCEDACIELLHRSFIDYSPSCEVEEQKYVMHEITSRLARSISGNKFFRAHGHELNCIPKDVQHLSIIPSHCDSEICFSSFTELTELSTLLLARNTLTDSVESQFHVMDIKALDECLRNFRCLKTLDLSHTDIQELPESVGYISSLCFLGINNTNIRRLPDSVCNLFNLQTLELQNSAFLVELPNDIKNLSSLNHLDASKEHGPIYIPPGVGQLTSLRTLTTFTVGGVSWKCKVSELAHLNSLKGFLHIQSLNNVENAEDAKEAYLAAKKLKKLSLEWCHSGENIESDGQISVAEHVLDALKPHNLLGELSIKGYYGLEFPGWTADHSLTDLVSITLDNCYNCEKLPPLGALPSLRFLFVQNLRGVQLIRSEFCVTESINHKSFPKLEILKLRDMYNLEYWYDVLDGDFPSLCSLSIERCPKLKSIPCFQYVSDISVTSCSKLNLPGLQSLQSLKIGNLTQRKCFALPFELRSLMMLEVTSCQHLSSVEGLSQLQSLKHLKFRTCPRLNFIQDEPLPDTLETVDIHSNCYALSSWVPNGFEELPDASEVYRKFIKRKCKAKGVDDVLEHMG